MDVEFPRLADTLVEGTVTRWLKSLGDEVRAGEPLFEVTTDKVDTEVESPASGTLTEILVAEGDLAAVGQIIARLGTHPDADAAPAPSSPSQPPAPNGLSPMRRRIAERMQEARATIAQGACVREIDVSHIERKGRSWTAFFVKAVAAAAGLREIGIAVEVPGGLVVPVVHDADRSTVGDISARIDDLAARARTSSLSAADVSGGQFTVTNVGSTGALMAFPLVNPGQPGILAPGAVRQGRAFVTLGYDRRHYDDYAADRLLAKVEEEVKALR